MARIFSRYRSAHEFKFEETVRTLAAYSQGRIDRAELRRFVLWRDEQGRLEMDSASFAVDYVDILAEAFPDARFILTMRDCFSWLDSLLNMVLLAGVRLSSWVVEYGQTILGPSFTREVAGSRETLIRHLPEIIDSGLAYWSRANTTLLTSLPSDRTLVLRTHEISSRLGTIADCVGVPESSLIADRSHLFKARRRFHVLSEVDVSWLRLRADERCGRLMDAHFPGCTVETFLHQDQVRPSFAAPDIGGRKPDGAGRARAEGDTFADYLEVVRPDVPPALIASQGMAAITEVASHFSGSLAGETYGFECNLSQPEPAADFWLLVQAGAGRPTLTGGIPAELRDHSGWRWVHEFLATWGNPRSTLNSGINDVWLEFEVAGAAGNIPLPGVSHGYRRVASDIDSDLSTEQCVEATHQAFEIVTGDAIDPAVLDRVRSCFELLPPGGYVSQMAAMIPRETDAVRVCVTTQEPPEILPYLDQLGWAGERERLAGLLEELHGRTGHLALVLDVGKSVRSALCIECYLEPDGTPQRDRWAPFLEFLVRRDMALEPKCRALLSYPGQAYEHLEGEHWPPALRTASALLGPSLVSVFRRGIDHVKLTLEPGRPIQAKAYLSVRHLWVTLDSIPRHA